MIDVPRAHPAPRARAVADPPIDGLLALADDLARAWAMALISASPMQRLASIPLADLARDAPTLCAQMLRAVQSDVELDRLTGQGAPSGREQSARATTLCAITGAHDADSAIDAIETLRSVLWEALLDELRLSSSVPGGRARLMADLADRLGYVCSRTLAVGIRAIAPAPALAPLADERQAHLDPDRDPPAAHDASHIRLEAVIVDEHTERPQAWDESPPMPPRAAPACERPSAWDESSPTPDVGAGDEIEIRDQRAAEGPAAWIGSIGRQLTRFRHDGRPFAVLLVELLEIERIRREESAEELDRLAGLIEDTLTAELRSRHAASLTRESSGRYWLLVPETGRSEVDDLAEHLARTIASSVTHRDAPVEVVLGSAVCPEDGAQAPTLAAHADVGLYAARSAARAMSGGWPAGSY